MSEARPTEIRIGLATCGVASGARRVKDAIEEVLGGPDAGGNGSGVRVKAVGCSGVCNQEPLVEVVTPSGESRLYGAVSPAAARRIALQSRPAGGILRRAAAVAGEFARRMIDDGAWTRPEDLRIDEPGGPISSYSAGQVRIVMENCGKIDPLDIGECLEHGAYEALGRCLKELSPEEVISLIDKAGLRGRGGAGFPTARKWAFARSQPSSEKYVVCNSDEGDPGAFMDRLVLESDPHRVLEGLAIAAYAVGCRRAFIYVRAEYPIAVAHVREAVAQARDRGLLGGDIMGTGFGLEIEIREGAGAFVCGEESAMIASIEGRRGMPRFRPPYPAEKGLWGHPTVINNVETLACVPWIIRNGPEEFSRHGTATSKGTKVFALAGKVRRGGLIEVPMGITIRRIVEEIGGGIAGGHSLKAVQIGGPSGGCLPADLADTPIDFEALTGAGAMMGSGGLVVLDETDCMVDVARFFLDFTQNESCGKCTFCRVGTKRMLEILERLCSGDGAAGDIAELEGLARHVRRTSLCGLGKTAPNPVLTTLRYFRDEYEAHVAGRCPAGKCTALISYFITDRCIGCTLCSQSCPSKAIAPDPFHRHVIDDVKCIRCGGCKSVCPSDAVEITDRLTPRPAPAEGSD